MLHRFGVAIGVGLLLAVLIDLWPAAGFPLALLTIAVLVLKTLSRRPLDSYRLIEVAGVTLGVDALFLYGLARGLAVCGQSQDFCGNANLVPLAALTAALIGLGLTAAAVAYRRLPTRRTGSRH
jgi:hypothetical protein